MLDMRGRFVIVGLPDEPLLGLNAMSLFGVGAFLGGSHISSEKECIQILQLVVDKGVKSWITLLPMSDAKKAVEAAKKNDLKGKYRFVLTQDLKEAEKQRVKNVQVDACMSSSVYHIPLSWHRTDRGVGSTSSAIH
jgi:hypothetical protein